MFLLLFPAAENLLPAIDQDCFNIRLTWFLSLPFTSLRVFVFNSLRRDQVKNLTPNFIIFQHLVCHLQMK